MNCNISTNYSYSYVTGFEETLHVCGTKIEIHFIAYYNSCTQALSRYSDKFAMDKQVCFYRWLFADPVKPQKIKSDLVGATEGH